MTHFRFIPLAFALAISGALVACGTPAAPSMGSTSASPTAAPGTMAKMDVQMSAMRAMHEKMMAAKTPEERTKLMPEHMKAMQDGMEMMRGMSETGDGTKGTHAMGGAPGAHHQVMAKHMEMMQTMMSMMQQQMGHMHSR